jgi:peptidyl-prolyl cis-trans isomerase D
MLHFIRERAKGWVAWLIVGLISIPFALWGVNSYLTGASEVIVATVNDEKISQAEFQNSLQQYRDRMRQMLGEQFDPTEFDNTEVKKQILDNLIQQRLLLAASDKLGQRVSDEQINQIIRATDAFHVDGEFDSQRYKMQLQRAGYSPAAYEAQVRIDLLSQQLTGSVDSTAMATNYAVNNLLRLEKQQRTIEYGTVNVAPFKEQVSLSEEDLVLFYQDNKADFVSPERMSVNYVELSIADMAEQIVFDEAEIEQYYIDNQSQFMSPGQRQASHILIESDEVEAQAKLKTIQAKLAAGVSFEELAKQFSDDTGSAESGGDLGLIEMGVMGSVFEDALFSLNNVGDISVPVKTEFGYHLIKLTGIEESHGQSFEQAREEVEAAFKKQQAQQLFFDKAELLANISYESPEGLDIVAEELGLEIKTTDLFTREGGEGLAAYPKVVGAAFGNDVLEEDLNSTVIQLSDDHLVVIHKKQYIEESQLPFDVVSDIISERLKTRQARKLAKEKGSELIKQIQSGSLPRLLFEPGVWQDAMTISRTDMDVNQELSDHVFKMAKPEEHSVVSGFTASNGNYIIVKLNQVIEGDPSLASEEDKAGLSAYLSRYRGNAELQAFLAGLKADADVAILDNKLK